MSSKVSSEAKGSLSTSLVNSTSVLSGGVLELHGRDAGAFAQAQLMNDVRALADGQWQWTGWLNPKGRVIALAALLRLAEDRYWLLLPDHPPARLAEQLRSFVFRSKTTLTTREDLTTRGTWSAPAAFGSDARHDRFDRLDTLTRLDWSGERPRTLWVGPSSDLERALAPHRDLVASTAAWATEDLAHGLPRLSEAAIAAHTPQMLGLTQLNAYSVKKGCYPGQEIVARTHFLGQAKRSLRRLHCVVPLLVGESVQADGKPMGEVLCAASDGDRHEALAVLPLDLDAHGRGTCALSGAVSAASVSLVDFKRGLAR